MQNRPQDEQFLYSSIISNNIPVANYLINSIQNIPPELAKKADSPKLTSTDINGNGFLFIAIKHSKTIAEQLFKLQKDNVDILFSKNKKERTLFWRAAKSKNISMLNNILLTSEIYADKNPRDIPIWLDADHLGNTPLHAAVMSKGIETTEFLLSLYKSKSTAEKYYSYLNQSNLQGQTILHYAITAKSKSLPLIARLAIAGCDWTIYDNVGKSALHYFLNLDEKSQNIIFSALVDQHHATKPTEKNNEDEDDDEITIKKPISLVNYRTHQVKLLDAIHDHFVKNNEMEKKKFKYHSFASMISLQQLILAKANTDEKIKHELSQTKKALKHQMNLELTSTSSTLISSTDIFEEEPEPDEPLVDYMQINQDRLTLFQLIEDINTYINDLTNNPRPSSTKRAFSIIIPILAWLLYGGVEGWLLYYHFAILPNIPCQKWHIDHCDVPNIDDLFTNSAMSCSLVGIFLGVFTITTSITSPYCLWDSEGPIANTEWKLLSVDINESVLAKLKELKPDQAPANNQQYITDLNTQFTSLEMTHHRKDVITTFEQIALILKNIQKSLNQGHYKHGMTLFKPLEQRYDFVVIEPERVKKKNADTEGEESLLLTDTRSINSNYQTIKI